MNKQEAIEKIDRVLSSPRSIGGYPYDYEDGLRYAKNIINQIDEPERPVIPKFVARAIETHKALGKSLHSLSYLTNNKEYNEWLRSDMKIKPERFEMVARAWLDGYEVEQERRYKAVLPNLYEEENVLHFSQEDEVWYFNNDFNDNVSVDKDSRYHTRKELEDAGFGWVCDCEGVEVQEVE